MFWLIYILGWLPIRGLFPFKVYGAKNYDKKKNYIITCNHQSNFDALILDYAFGKKNRFIAKKELVKTKTSSFWFKKVFGAIPIDREVGLTISQVKECYNILKNGENLGIFPEGTRGKDFAKDDIKGGASFFAIKTKTPIIPCYILEKQKLLKRNVVLIGKPFELSEFYNKKLDKDTIEQADKVIKSNICDLYENYLSFQSEKKLLKKVKKLPNIK